MPKYDSFIQEEIRKLASKHKFVVDNMKADKDHIHILVSAAPRTSPYQISSLIKQHTTYELWQTFPNELRNEFWKKHEFWTRSNFINSVGSVSKEIIDKYIEQQGHSSSTLKGTRASVLGE